MPRYVIIGMGVAGIAAAEAIRSVDPQGSITLVGDEPDGYYSRPGLAYFLTGEIEADQLLPFNGEDFQRLGVQRLQARAARIQVTERLVGLHNGVQLSYDRLLLATGAQAIMMNIPGIQAHGVFKMDNLTDARHIIRMARKARNAVVVGGGITALEIVEGLIAQRVKTHYLMRGERYWSNVLDETESRLVEARLKKHGVKIHYHTEIAEVLTQRGRVKGVRASNGREIACNLLGIAIGVRPRTELARTAGLHVDRGVLVDAHMQTSAADIFAAGDIAQVYDPLSGQSVLDSLWDLARQQGRVAGLNMASWDGHKTAYRKTVPFNVTRLADIHTTIIGAVGRGRDSDLNGIARGDSETWRQAPEVVIAQEGQGVNRVRLMIGARTILGAVLMGDQALSRLLQDLITHQVDITPLRSDLLQPGAPVKQRIAAFWNDWSGMEASIARQS